MKLSELTYSAKRLNIGESILLYNRFDSSNIWANIYPRIRLTREGLRSVRIQCLDSYPDHRLGCVIGERLSDIDDIANGIISLTDQRVLSGLYLR